MSQSARLRILFTEGSSTSARQALFALGPRHDVEILDPNPLCVCRFSRFTRRWHRCPPFSRDPEGYLAVVEKLLASGRFDVLFPTHEQVYLLAKFRQRLGERSGLAVPSFESMDQMMSKANFVRLIDELGLQQPETTIVRSRSDLLAAEPPCFVKIDYSTAGEGVRHVCDRQELQQAADVFEQAGWLDAGAEVLVQRPARGRKGGASAVFQHGRLVAAHCCEARALGVGGSSMGQRSVAMPQAVEALATIGRHLDWHGALVVEHFFDPETGRLELLECNPRIGETFNALASGVNLCEQLVRVSLGEPVEPILQWREGVCTHQGFLILMAKALDGANRRQLLREMLQGLRHRGLFNDSQDELSRPGDDWPSILPLLAVSALLLARPQAAQWVVTKTVNNYALSRSAAESIRAMAAPVD